MEQIKTKAESPISKIDMLSELLAAHLDEKVNLYHNPYGETYGIALTTTKEGDFHGMIVDGAHTAEATQMLTDVYNEYLSTLGLGEEKKYRTAMIDSNTNSTTPETLERSSFILCDFLEDMKKYFEAKAN